MHYHSTHRLAVIEWLMTDSSLIFHSLRPREKCAHVMNALAVDVFNFLSTVFWIALVKWQFAV